MARRYAKACLHIDEKVWQQVEALIREEWSLEQIVGRLEDEQGLYISHEWIYQYIYADRRSGGDLHRSPRCLKPRRKYYEGHDRHDIITNQVSIDERLLIVQARKRVGGWEGDTVIGKGYRGAQMTLVERKSLYTVYMGPSASRQPGPSVKPTDATSHHTDASYILSLCACLP